MVEIPVIAVDGPSGVGKGTISHRLARQLGWHFLDSGALYRLTALAARQVGIALDAEPEVAGIAAALAVRFLPQAAGDTRIVLHDQDVTDAIRTEGCGNDASRVAALPAVRAALLERQRAFREPPGLVADGRDMGTTVFPDAPAKLFLTARADVRAERRYKQLKEKGLSANLAGLLREIAERDERDRTRSTSPLRPADDAIIIDTSDLDVDAVFDQVLDVVRRRI